MKNHVKMSKKKITRNSKKNKKRKYMKNKNKKQTWDVRIINSKI